MTADWSALLGAALSVFGVGLICGHFIENDLTLTAKAGILMVAFLVGAALGRVAFEKR